MKRLARHLFTLCSALSLVLCVALCAVWVRSYFARDGLGRLHYTPGIDKEDHHIWVQANCGVFEVFGGGDPVENFSAVKWQRQNLPVERDRLPRRTDEPPLFRSVGVYWEQPRQVSTGEMWWTVRFPIAFPALLSVLGAVPMLAARRRRHAAGTCPTCGYDLRASPEQCPECGAAAAAPSAFEA